MSRPLQAILWALIGYLVMSSFTAKIRLDTNKAAIDVCSEGILKLQRRVDKLELDPQPPVPGPPRPQGPQAWIGPRIEPEGRMAGPEETSFTGSPFVDQALWNQWMSSW